MTRPIRLAARFVALLAPALAFACTNDPEGPASRVGEYHLVAVAIDPVPATVTFVHAGLTISEVTSGVLRLWADGTHTMSIAVRAATDGGPVVPRTIAFGGEFTIRADTVVLTAEEGAEAWVGAFAIMSGRTAVTFDRGAGVSLIFAKTLH